MVIMVSLHRSDCQIAADSSVTVAMSGGVDSSVALRILADMASAFFIRECLRLIPIAVETQSCFHA
jgi:tRNA(Ile)-lysidine synthase TilS/MesJ